MIETVRWMLEDGEILSGYDANKKLLPGKLRIIDQTLLPETFTFLELDDVQEIFDAILRLSVRGAPAIGCSVGLGLIAVAQHLECETREEFICETRKISDKLASSRPTAVNLFWALNRCMEKLENSTETDINALKNLLVKEGLDILSEDIEMCKNIGKHGNELIKDGVGIITHCNAGALATGDYGTALSPMYSAHESNKKITVYADETRPLLQGARLTAWELDKAGIDVISICDNMAGQVMKEGKIDMVIVGTDRIAANGDIANKIGTYGLAILAKYHNIPFYVAAPYTTIDITLGDGSLIPIEIRDEEEIRNGFGRRTVLENIKAYNPAFDVTPNELIAGIITERGILYPPFTEKIDKLING